MEISRKWSAWDQASHWGEMAKKIGVGTRLPRFYSIFQRLEQAKHRSHKKSAPRHPSLRKQPTLRDTTIGFPAKWRLRNERRNSILMKRHYSNWYYLVEANFPRSLINQRHFPDLGSNTELVWNFCAFLRHHFAWTTRMASRSVGSFLRLLPIIVERQSTLFTWDYSRLPGFTLTEKSVTSCYHGSKISGLPW